MADEGALYDSFQQAYLEALADGERDRLDECIEKCLEILRRPHVPCDIWLDTIVLLSSVVPRCEDAHACHEIADSYWHALRRSNPVDGDARIEAVLEEMRVALDALKNAIDQEKENLNAEKSNEDDQFGEGMMASRAAVKEETEDADAESFDLEELLAADARLLGMIVEGLRKLDLSKVDVESFVLSLDCEGKGQEEVGGVDGKGGEMDEKAADQAQVGPSSSSTRSDSTDLTPPSTPGSGQEGTGRSRLAVRHTHLTELTSKVKSQYLTSLENEKSSLKCRMLLAEEEHQSVVRRTRMVEEELESLKRRKAMVGEEQVALRQRMQALAESLAELQG